MGEAADLALERPEEGISRGIACARAGDLDGAQAAFARVLSRDPANWSAWSNLGIVLKRMGRAGPSVAALRRAQSLAPDDRRVASNLASALLQAGEAEEACSIRRRLWETGRGESRDLRNYALALRKCWRNEDAIRLVDAAERAHGTDALGEARLQRALAHLVLGDYARGFADFESRYLGGEVALPENAPWPRWAGEDVAGRRIVVLPEQGFGDALLFARFLPALKAMGATVTHVLRPPLARLLAEADGIDHVAPHASVRDSFDFYTPNASLPHLVGLPPDGPPPPPRLVIPDDSRARARALVAPFDGAFRIGMVWTGASRYAGNARRSTTPDRFLPLAEVPGVQLFSLHKGEGHAALRETGMEGLIVDACADDRDLADAAAVIDEMDLMITTDTAVVHVAASLGKPVWNLLDHEGYWLYGTGDTTPWYPSMRLYRQPAPGDWESVFARVTADLRRLLAARA